MFQRAEICADKGLYTLADAVKKRGADDGDIRHDSVCRHTRVACEAQDYTVKGENDNTGGKLRDEIGDAAAEDLQDFPKLRFHAD